MVPFWSGEQMDTGEVIGVYGPCFVPMGWTATAKHSCRPLKLLVSSTALALYPASSLGR